MRLIALYTDFGRKDIYTGILKASILSLQPENKVIDMSHDIDKHDIVQAALFIKNAYPFFNNGSIHMAVINSFYGKKVDYIFFEKNHQFFIGPNNGLYSLVFPNLDQNDIYSIQPRNQTFSSLLNELGNLIFSICRKELDHYSQIDDFKHRLNLQPVITADQIRA